MALKTVSNVSILRRSEPLGGSHTIVVALLGAMLFAQFFLPRFALHFGQRELSFDVIVMLVSAAFNGGGLTGRVSAPSFLLLASMYFAYVFVNPDPSGATFEATLRLFRRFSLIVAFAGIAQFAAQVAIPGP